MKKTFAFILALLLCFSSLTTVRADNSDNASSNRLLLLNAMQALAFTYMIDGQAGWDSIDLGIF